MFLREDHPLASCLQTPKYSALVLRVGNYYCLGFLALETLENINYLGNLNFLPVVKDSKISSAFCNLEIDGSHGWKMEDCPLHDVFCHLHCLKSRRRLVDECLRLSGTRPLNAHDYATFDILVYLPKKTVYWKRKPLEATAKSTIRIFREPFQWAQ